MKIKFDKIRGALYLLCTLILVVGCKDSSDIAPLSRITYFPDFILEGETEYEIACGESFTLPGARVEEEGTEINFDTEISGRFFNKTDGTDINTEIPDIYVVQYSAINKDGFPGTANRTVDINPCKGDFVSSIEGEYISTVIRGGSFDPRYENLGPIYVADFGDGTYGISNALGGYYDYGRSFGPGYTAYGAVVRANDIAANDFVAEAIGVFPIWGNTVEISNFKVDPATKTITYVGSANFGNGEFEVTLTQVD
ncbi:MAG: DUF5011 domain-containing protein [Saprospiraceae bacterium]|nr:DUF5011 domain-containing protein [Saprospiraceae bacterium]